MNTDRFVSRSIVTLLATGLLVRLLLAYVFLSESGYPRDIQWYSGWALAVASDGPARFYLQTNANYPPGYIYILWLLGSLGRALAYATGADVQWVIQSLIKIPPILLDIVAGFLLYRTIRRWCAESATADRLAIVSAASYVFNPVALYDSAIWAQTDACGAVIMLLGITALLWWPPEVAAAVATISVLMKPQFGVVLVPITGVVLVRRHLLPPSKRTVAALSEHWSTLDGPLRIMTSTILALTLFYALVLPFNLNLHTFLVRMSQTAREYNFLTVNAFNPWALVPGNDHGPLFIEGVTKVSQDDVPLMGSVTGVTIGSVLLSCGFLLGLVRLLWRSDGWSIVIVGAYLSLCFFILPTRVHERYLFPAFAFTSLLIALDRRWLWATAVLAAGSLINFHAVLSQIGTENIRHLPLSSFARSPAGILGSVVLQVGVFLFAACYLRPSLVPLWRSSTQCSIRTAPLLRLTETEM